MILEQFTIDEFEFLRRSEDLGFKGISLTDIYTILILSQNSKSPLVDECLLHLVKLGIITDERKSEIQKAI